MMFLTGKRTALTLASGLILAGCVSQSAYDALKQQNDQLQAQNSQLQQQVQSQQAEIEAGKTQVNRLREAIKYTVNSDLLFAPGSWKLSPRGKHIMADMAHKLAPTQTAHLLVAGYTDNQPIGPGLQAKGISSNDELSQKRADAVMQYLVSVGVNPELVSAKGYGESNPIASNDTARGRAKNRRVELSIASG